MTLIFDKLDELAAEITQEQEDDDAWLAGEHQKYMTLKDDYDSQINTAETTINTNKLANGGDDGTGGLMKVVTDERTNWYNLREQEVGSDPEGVHPRLIAMEATRTSETAVAREAVDERNAAIDVLIEALFLVCERFNRYKNTALCVQIK